MKLRKRGDIWYARVWVDGKRVTRTTKCTDRGAAETIALQWEQDAASKATRQVVYACRAKDGLIKIGTTTNLPSRLKSIRAHSPLPIELIALWPGAWDVEKRIHERFAHLRVHGEWFRPEPELLEFIERSRWGEE